MLNSQQKIQNMQKTTQIHKKTLNRTKSYQNLKINKIQTSNKMQTQQVRTAQLFSCTIKYQYFKFSMLQKISKSMFKYVHTQFLNLPESIIELSSLCSKPNEQQRQLVHLDKQEPLFLEHSLFIEKNLFLTKILFSNFQKFSMKKENLFRKVFFKTIFLTEFKIFGNYFLFLKQGILQESFGEFIKKLFLQALWKNNHKTC
eukprot:TRINITY_DN2246_c2_g1_i1.p1 TRINITY_DN2246_c2_g1~~TRINITY_DN2246_c2_g1_i1.p1  ORF type:complete len:201 (+),score=-12.20 TRINITY_DN2246_c2_g1_i1:235-837(+)